MKKKSYLNHIKSYWFAYFIIILSIVLLAFPVYVAFIASTHDASTISRGQLPLTPGKYLLENYNTAWNIGKGERIISIPVRKMLINSLIMASIIAIGKIALSLLSAYAIEYFYFPFRSFIFWLIFITLMLPLEVRIIPTYKVVSDLKLINTFTGLTVPLMVSATGTLLFRQGLRNIPKELLEAAKIDGAGPLTCLVFLVIPLMLPTIFSLFVILFIYGWNQYLWPLLITTDINFQTIVMGIVKMIGGADTSVDWNIVMASTMISLLIPALIVIFMQKLLIRGLTETEK
uniref:sn-glycerol-3-phosphate transport system permease protein UgpE n=1 Tax=Dictyoglomus thermophilum TaxID=14 RepID=A0A7C3RLQ6_DICTH